MHEISIVGPRGLRLRTLVPQSRRERTRGLLGRSSLAADQALLLERTRSVHTLCMRFTIKVALLDGELLVRGVRLLPPGRLVLGRRGVRHVLEFAAVADVRPGDHLRIEPSAQSPAGRRLYFPALPLAGG